MNHRLQRQLRWPGNKSVRFWSYRLCKDTTDQGQLTAAVFVIDSGLMLMFTSGIGPLNFSAVYASTLYLPYLFKNLSKHRHTPRFNKFKSA